MNKHIKTNHKTRRTMTGYRRKNRLITDFYRGCRAYFITIATADRAPVFVTGSSVSYHLDVLGRTAGKQAFDIIAYCYMPDHAHLLAVGKEQTSDLIALVKDYKQATGYHHKKQSGRTLWQKSFYDHMLRKNEAIHEVAHYILANPVRKQIVERPEAYPYSGSLVYGPDIFTI